MAQSLKISNILFNENAAAELLQKLKGVKSPGLAKLKIALLTVQSDSLMEDEKVDYWKQIATELLYRIELYSSLKVINYTKSDVNAVAAQTRKLGLAVIVNALMEQFSKQHAA